MHTNDTYNTNTNTNRTNTHGNAVLQEARQALGARGLRHHEAVRRQVLLLLMLYIET